MKDYLKYIFHIDHVLIIILSFLLWGAFLLCAYNISFLDPIDRAFDNFSMSDMFFEIDNRTDNPDTCNLITLVDMTDLHARADIGELLDEVNQLNPLCIGVDLIFEGEKDDAYGNIVLENAVMELGDNAYFAQKLVDYNNASEQFTSAVRSYFAPTIPIKEAYANFTDNLEHTNIRALTIRKNVCGEKVLSFPASIAAHIDTNLVQEKVNELTINYQHTVFPILRYDEVVTHPEWIANRIVLIGTLHEEQDMHLTPIGKMAGMMIQAYSLRTLLEGNHIIRLPWYLNWLICFFICWLLQLQLTAVSKWASTHEQNGIVFFFKKANLLFGAVLIVWLFFINYILFIYFVNHHLSIDATMLFAMMIILLEARGIYEAMINAFAKKYQWKWINNSLFLES